MKGNKTFNANLNSGYSQALNYFLSHLRINWFTVNCIERECKITKGKRNSVLGEYIL